MCEIVGLILQAKEDVEPNAAVECLRDAKGRELLKLQNVLVDGGVKRGSWPEASICGIRQLQLVTEGRHSD